MTKINSLGFGVIYYWHWGWSYSPKFVAPRSKKENELKEAAKTGSIPYSSSNIEKSGRFMYIGLAIQLPTMVRMRGHVKDAQSDNPVNTKAMALAQAITESLTTAGKDGIIENPYLIPKIIHVCSLFDLAPLESYYVDDVYDLTQEKNQTFLDLINGGKVSKAGGGNTIGVNTKAGEGESAGQGSPLKQGFTRGITEWILAANWFLIERDPMVLAARNISPYKFGKIADAANNVKGPMSEKVFQVLQQFSVNDNVSSQLQEKLKSITLRQVEGIIKIFGVSEKAELKGKEKNKYITDPEELNKNFSVDKLFDEGALGIKFEEMFSFDIGSSRKNLSSQQKLLLKKTDVATELRTALVEFFTNITDADFGPESAESITANLTSTFENGLQAFQVQLIEMENKAKQISAQNKQLQNKLNKEAQDLTRQDKKLRDEIDNAIDELNIIIRKAIIEIAQLSGIKSLRSVLEDIPVPKNLAAQITEKNIKLQKINSSKAIEKAVKEGATILGNVYYKFQQLQGRINKMIEALKKLEKATDKKEKEKIQLEYESNRKAVFER